MIDYMGDKLKNMKKLCFYMAHPAPYRDKVLELFSKDSRYETDIVYYRGVDEDHSEWNLELKKTEHIRYCHKVIWLKYWGEYRSEAVKWFKENRYDLIIVCGHHPYTSYRLIRLAQKTGIPYIYMCDTTQLPLEEKVVVEQKGLKSYVLKSIVKRAAALWVPGKASRIYWEQYEPNARIFEGCYTLDYQELNNQYEYLPEKEDLKRKIGLPEKSTTFLFVGKLIETRRIELLLQAFMQLKKKDQNVSLVVIGDGDEEEKVRKCLDIIDDHSIAYIPRVSFDDLVQYYKASDIYVHPGEEPYSLAVAQAVLHGMPVIATDRVGAVYDYIRDGKNGIVLSDVTAEKLADAMIDVMKNTEMMESSDAREIQMEKYRNVQWATMELTRMVESILE